MATLTDPARLDALARSGLLAHGQRARLDLLCQTAASIVRVPAAQVNVLTAEQQISVGKYPPDGDRELPVMVAGCRQVVLAEHPVIVPDTREHPVMCGLPWAADWRAYLGVPVYAADQVIGSFCVLDRPVRAWTAWDIAGLQGLARLAGLSVE